jgi:hypothetical protein
VMERSYALLDTDEIVLFGMAVNGAPPSEIAAVSGDHPDEIRRQLRGLLERLQTRPTEPEPPPTDGLVGPGPSAPNRLSAR